MVALCPSCGHHGEQRYNGAQIVEQPDDPEHFAEALLYTCHDGCGTTYVRDLEPRPTLTADDLCRVTDRREFLAQRNAVAINDRQWPEKCGAA
jgi:hypothetical protein